MARIIIEWDRETQQANYTFEEMSHEEAQQVLLAVARRNHDHVVIEVARRAFEEGQRHGHELHGHSDGG